MLKSRKLAVKLILAVSIVVIVMSTILGYIMYDGITASFEENFKERIGLVANTAAALLDADKQSEIKTAADMNSSVYKEEREKLVKLQKNMDVKYIYTMRESANDLEFIIDVGSDTPTEVGYKYENCPGMQAAFDGNTFIEDKFDTDEWGTFLSGYAPIKGKDGSVKAIVGVDIDAHDILTMRNIVLKQMLMIFFLFDIIIILFLAFVSRKITKPVVYVTEKMVEASEVSGDLSLRIKVKSNDEIGRLSDAFNKLFGTIHTIIKKVKVTTVQLADSSVRLSTEMDGAVQGMNRLSENSMKLASGIDSVGELFSKARGDIESYSGSIQEVAAKSEEMNDFAQEINSSASTASAAVRHSTETVLSLGKLSEGINTDIFELGEFTQSIGTIVDTINGIAKQTNMLALNAMIEAQRAGESGKGFLVVAENIRVLSNNTQKSVNEVRGLVAEVVGRINKIVGSQMQFEPIINKAVEDTVEADAIIEKMLTEFGKIAGMISTITEVSEKQAEGIQNLTNFIDDIYTHFSKQREVTHSTTAATQEISAAAESIAENAGTLSEIAKDLEDLVKNFKV